MGLKEYEKKRKFNTTPEPGVDGNSKPPEKALSFVIQRHQATRLHYDLRLEMEGVLKSWAVPKGPSMNPADKRLAMMTEDHPLEYKDFEGVIPKGNYGAGVMDIWDKGWYHTEDEEDKERSEKILLKGIHKGRFKFILHGEKVRGAFSLVKMKDDKKGNSWLLTKIDDEHATDKPYDSEDLISEEAKAAKKKKDKGYGNPEVLKKMPAEAVKEKMPDHVPPMLAKLVDAPFDDPKWVFEIKWDGYRAMAAIKDGEVKLRSRNGLIFDKYTPINKDLEKLGHNAILDGEIVILDEEGKADFQKLQKYNDHISAQLYFQVFDILYLNGYNLLHVPLGKRQEILMEVVHGLEKTRYSEHIESRGKEFFKAAEEHDLEGIIGKRAASIYIPGKRSSDWVKIKTQKRQEAIICGYTDPKGGRQYFGSLVLGVYEKGKLQYIGSSGGGFSQQKLKELHKKLEALRIDESPFKEKVPGSAKMNWVEPELVCEVAFAEWTKDGCMRHPVFLGMRPDKLPEEVVREKEKPAAKVKKESEAQADEQKSIKPEAKKKRSVAKTGADSREFELNGHIIVVNNWNKVYWPESGYTKGDMVEYYLKIQKYILPYLKDRPESLNRHPNGINGENFYQKNMAGLAPDWIESFSVPRGSESGEIKYMLCQNKASLMYMANLGCIEIHPWSSRVSSPDHPDWVVIDLDPAENTFEEVVETALAVKEVLDEAGIVGFPKTSGSSGIHIYIPLGAKYTYEQGKNFANIIAMETHRKLPKLTSIERMTRKRIRQIYLDYLQNIKGQTLAAPYSVRPKPGATVSAPLEWSEVRPGLHPSHFTIKNMPERVKEKGDLFKGVLGKGIDMLACLSKLE